MPIAKRRLRRTKRVLLLLACVWLSVRVGLTVLASRDSPVTREVGERMTVLPGMASSNTSSDACLLIHGYALTPAEFEPLANRLIKSGFTVVAPWIPDHGASPKRLADGDPWSWAQEMGRHLHELKASHARVFVVGRSLGGTIAIDLASRYPVEGIVAINPLLLLKRYGPVRPETLYGFARFLTPYVPYLKSLNMSRPEMLHLAAGTSWVPTAQAIALSRYASEVHGRAERVRAPALVITSLRDRIVDPSSSGAFAERFSSKRVDRLELSRSGHIAQLDWDGPQVIEAVARFLEGLRSTPAGRTVQ